MRQEGTRNSDKLYSEKIFLFDGAGGSFKIQFRNDRMKFVPGPHFGYPY